MQTVLQAQLYFFCLVVIIIIWFSGDRRRTSRRDMDTKLFRALLLSTAAMILTNALTLLLDGRPGPLARLTVASSSTLYYLFHSLPLPLSILYADFQLFRDEKRLPRLVAILGPAILATGLMALLTPFLGLVFTVDPDNHYRRGPWFPAFAATQFLLSLYLVLHIVRNRRKVSRRVFAVLVAYPIPMIIASILQTAFYGLILLWPTMTLFLATVAFHLENRRSKTDYLTGAANRRSLDEELERRIEGARGGRRLYGLLIDIDAFKGINDNLGHGAGDRALEDVSAILQASVRVDDLVARMGGDEFVVLADSREAIDLEGLVRRIEEGIEVLNASGQRPYRLSLSLGRAEFNPAGGGEGRAFLSLLDADMYRRKLGKAVFPA